MEKYSTQVNTTPYNYGLNVLRLLHNIVDNFRHNKNTLLPSKEYNIFQHKLAPLLGTKVQIIPGKTTLS